MVRKDDGSRGFSRIGGGTVDEKPKLSAAATRDTRTLPGAMQSKKREAGQWRRFSRPIKEDHEAVKHPTVKGFLPEPSHQSKPNLVSRVKASVLVDNPVGRNRCVNLCSR